MLRMYESENVWPEMTFLDLHIHIGTYYLPGKLGRTKKKDTYPNDYIFFLSEYIILL